MEQVQAIQVSDQKAKGLRWWNLSMGFLHLIQGIVVLALSTSFSLPVVGNFLRFDVLTQSLQPYPETLFNINIGVAVAVFLFLSAFFHFLVSTVFYKTYLKNLSQHINIFRWIEYSFSASIMLVIISMLVGIYDIAALIVIFGINAAMILFGWIMEKHNGSTSLTTGQNAKTDWTSFAFGSIIGAIPWIAIALYLFFAGGDGQKAPSFVYWIYFSIFVFFNCFAINQVLQYKKTGKWQDYLYGEKVYIILSLVAKSLLAWQVFAGTLRPM